MSPTQLKDLRIIYVPADKLQKQVASPTSAIYANSIPLYPTILQLVKEFLTTLREFENDGDAIAAGLKVGDIYKIASGGDYLEGGLFKEIK